MNPIMNNAGTNNAERPARSSRLSGFYRKSVAERTNILAEWANLSNVERAILTDSLSINQADKMIENVVGRYTLPMGIGTNFIVNGPAMPRGLHVRAVDFLPAAHVQS